MDLNNLNTDEINIKNYDIFNYKGYFVEKDNEDDEPKYFEFGAHFSYKELYKKLKILKEKKIEEEKNNKIEKITQIKKNKISFKERKNTKDKINENNFNLIMKIFENKIKSRNIGEIDNDNNKKELTFIPKINLKSNLSIKKDEKNEISIKSCKYNSNKLNYMRINNNNNQKNIIYNKSNSIKKINLNNKIIKFELNKIKFNSNSNCGKYIITKNKNQKKICQQTKLISRNKNLNKNNNYSFIINSHKYFKTQLNNMKSKSITNIKVKNLSFNSTLKNSLNIKGINNNKDNDENKYAKNILKFNYNSKINEFSKKNVNNLDLKLDKLSINSYFSYKIKNKISSTIECPLNVYKWKENKYSNNFSKKILTILPIYNSLFSSSNKSNSKNKEKFKYLTYKKYLPNKSNSHSSFFNSRKNNFSLTDNNKSLLQNKTIEKIKLNKDNEIDKEKDLTQSSFKNKNNIIYSNLSLDYLNKSNNNKNISKINENNKKVESNNIKENFNKLFDKKEIKSRNINNNFLFENTSSINIIDYKSTKNVNNNLLKLNKTYQKKNFIKINKKQINLYKAIINLKKENKKNKKILIDIPSSSKKKNSFMFQIDNNQNIKNFNSKGYIEKKNKKNKIINNNSYMYSLVNNKSNKKSNGLKDSINKLKRKERSYLENKKINIGNNEIIIHNNRNNNSNKIFRKNNINNKINNNLKKIGLKTHQFMGKKRNSKNKININININNSNIIYNKIMNNKDNKNNSIDINNNIKFRKSNKKIITKSFSFQQSKNSINNSKLGSINLIDNNDKNKKFSKIPYNNIKNCKKINLVNMKFPKSKFLNIINNKDKK